MDISLTYELKWWAAIMRSRPKDHFLAGLFQLSSVLQGEEKLSLCVCFSFSFSTPIVFLSRQTKKRKISFLCWMPCFTFKIGSLWCTYISAQAHLNKSRHWMLLKWSCHMIWITSKSHLAFSLFMVLGKYLAAFSFVLVPLSVRLDTLSVFCF